MSRYNLECIVLKSINYKDADKIYTLYSKTKGKVSVIAKGVRKISSRRGGNLDTLNHVTIGISETTSGIKMVTEAKSLDSFRNLKKTLETCIKGYYISEVVHKITEENHESPEIFDLLASVLRLLNTEPQRLNTNIVIVWFELTLMKVLGYQIHFDKCAICNRVYSTSWNHTKFNLAVGGLICNQCNHNGISIKNTDIEVLYLLSSSSAYDLSELLKKKSYLYEFSSTITSNYVLDVLEQNIKTPKFFYKCT